MGSSKAWRLIGSSLKLKNIVQKVRGKYHLMEGPNYRHREENNEQ